MAENQADRLGGFGVYFDWKPHIPAREVDSAESAFSRSTSLHQNAFYQLYLQPSLGPSTEMLRDLQQAVTKYYQLPKIFQLKFSLCSKAPPLLTDSFPFASQTCRFQISSSVQILTHLYILQGGRDLHSMVPCW